MHRPILVFNHGGRGIVSSCSSDQRTCRNILRFSRTFDRLLRPNNHGKDNASRLFLAKSAQVRIQPHSFFVSSNPTSTGCEGSSYKIAFTHSMNSTDVPSLHGLSAMENVKPTMYTSSMGEASMSAASVIDAEDKADAP